MRFLRFGASPRVFLGLTLLLSTGCAHHSASREEVGRSLALLDDVAVGASKHLVLSRFEDLRPMGTESESRPQTYLRRSTSSVFSEQAFQFQGGQLVGISLSILTAESVVRFAKSTVEAMEARWGAPTEATMSLPDAAMAFAYLAWQHPDRRIAAFFSPPETLMRQARGLADPIAYFTIGISSAANAPIETSRLGQQPFRRSVLEGKHRDFARRVTVKPEALSGRLFPPKLSTLYLGAPITEYPREARRGDFFDSGRYMDLDDPPFSDAIFHSRRGRLVLVQLSGSRHGTSRHALHQLGEWCKRRWSGPPEKLFRLKSSPDDDAPHRVFVWEHRDGVTSLQLPSGPEAAWSVRIAHRSVEPRFWFAPNTIFELAASDRETVREEWEAAAGDPLPALLRKLGSPDARVRAEGVRGMGESGDPRALSVLEDLFVRESSATVLFQIPYWLNRLGGTRNEAVLKKNLSRLKSADYHERLHAIWAFRSIENPAAIPALREIFLNSGDRQLRQNAVATLAHLKDDELPAEVARMLNSSFQDSFEMGLWGLSELLFRQELDWGGGLPRPDPEPFLPRLRQLVAAKVHKVWPVTRQDALSMLFKLNDPELPSLLAPLLSEPDEWARNLAVTGFSRMGSTVALPSILAMSQSAEPRDRATAAGALGVLGGAATYPIVLRLARDPDHIVRAAAAAPVGKLGGVDSGATLEALSRDAHHYPRYLSLDGWAASKLPMPESLTLDLLNDSDEAVRHRAARYLFHAADSASLGIVFQILRDPEWVKRVGDNSRRMFLHRLLHQDDRAFLGSYLDLIGSSDGVTRRVALSWLRAKGPAETITLLRERVTLLADEAKRDVDVAIKKLESGDTKPDDGLIGTFGY